MSDQGPPATFGEVFEAVRRIVRGRGRRLPSEALVTYAEGEIEVSRTAADEYEVRHRGEVVFRAGATGGLSSAPAFTPGGWLEQVWRIDRLTQSEKGGKG